jgi:hypothetical protein
MPLAPKKNIRDSVFSNDLGFEKLTNNLSSFLFLKQKCPSQGGGTECGMKQESNLPFPTVEV